VPSSGEAIENLIEEFAPNPGHSLNPGSIVPFLLVKLRLAATYSIVRRIFQMTLPTCLKSFCAQGLAVLMLTAFVFAAPAATAARSSASAKMRRIVFAPGATEASVTGRLQGQKDKMHFVLRVRAGQHMYISVDSTQLLNPQIDVIYPSGEHMDRDMQGTQFRTDASQAGDYRIDVYEGEKGDPGNGVFVLKVKVD
jgi:hypothetical protein